MSVELVYILAASHSGSTLLAMMLGAHRQACTAGELKATHLGPIDRYRCSCGTLIRHCGFWRQVAMEMARRGIAFDIADAGTHFGDIGGPWARRLLSPLHRGRAFEAVRDAGLWLSPLWRQWLGVVQRRNLELVRTLAQLRGARVVIDSSKIGVRLKYLLRTPGLSVRAIHLTRDGRGVALTYMDPAAFADAGDPALRGGGAGCSRRSEELTLAQAAWQWRRSNEEAQCVLDSMEPGRWIRVRYEDLCSDAPGVRARLLEFMNLDPSQAVDDFRAVEHHVIGNGMRLDSTSEVRLDERWRDVLRGEQLDEFDSLAGAMNRRLGYV